MLSEDIKLLKETAAKIGALASIIHPNYKIDEQVTALRALASKLERLTKSDFGPPPDKATKQMLLAGYHNANQLGMSNVNFNNIAELYQAMTAVRRP